MIFLSYRFEDESFVNAVNKHLLRHPCVRTFFCPENARHHDFQSQVIGALKASTSIVCFVNSEPSEVQVAEIISAETIAQKVLVRTATADISKIGRFAAISGTINVRNFALEEAEYCSATIVKVLNLVNLGRFHQLELDVEETLHLSGITNVAARIDKFETPNVPAVLNSLETELPERLESLRGNQTIDGPLWKLLQQLESQSRKKFILTLNASNPLVQKLADVDRNSELIPELVAGLYNSALLRSNNQLLPDNADVINNQLVRLLDKLILDQTTFRHMERELLQTKMELRATKDNLVARGEPSAVEPERTGSAVPSGVLIDNVYFTLTGPPVFGLGTPDELVLWLHVEQQRTAVLELASSIHHIPTSEVSVKSEGPAPLVRGSRVGVALSIRGMRCVDRHKWVTWTGDIGTTSFVVQGLHAGAYPGQASVRLNGCEIARMSFVLHVGLPDTAPAEIPSQTTIHRRAFASYASEDRANVLSRVQGMEVAYHGLDVFLDVISLRSGENWEETIKGRIRESDVFYLFWCRHAMHSEWVEREWRWALQAKGRDFIDPVPLEIPELAPPPKELRTKHFNDPILPFIAAAGVQHSY